MIHNHICYKTTSKISFFDYCLIILPYYNKGKNERREAGSAKTRFDYNDIIFETRGDAELVLSELDELMDTYEMVSIQDLYSAAGLDCPYTYNNYGWTNIRSAAVIRVNDGYMIKLPKAKPL